MADQLLTSTFGTKTPRMYSTQEIEGTGKFHKSALVEGHGSLYKDLPAISEGNLKQAKSSLKRDPLRNLPLSSNKDTNSRRRLEMEDLVGESKEISPLGEGQEFRFENTQRERLKENIRFSHFDSNLPIDKSTETQNQKLLDIDINAKSFYIPYVCKLGLEIFLTIIGFWQYDQKK